MNKTLFSGDELLITDWESPEVFPELAYIQLYTNMFDSCLIEEFEQHHVPETLIENLENLLK